MRESYSKYGNHPNRRHQFVTHSVLREGFFLGLQADFELMRRRRQIADKLKAIRPRAA
jgi:hypothetical protein